MTCSECKEEMLPGDNAIATVKGVVEMDNYNAFTQFKELKGMPEIEVHHLECHKEEA